MWDKIKDMLKVKHVKGKTWVKSGITDKKWKNMSQKS